MRINRIKKGDRTRQFILKTAASLIAQKGLARVTARRLADSAELSLGTISHHFPKMEDLLYQVTDFLLNTGIAELLPRTTSHRSLPARNKLSEFVQQNFTLFAGYPEYYYCISLAYTYARAESRFENLLNTAFEQSLQQLYGFFEELANEEGIIVSPELLNDYALWVAQATEGGLIFSVFLSHRKSKDLNYHLRLLDRIVEQFIEEARSS